MLAPTALNGPIGPNASLLTPASAFDREGSVISDDADMRSLAAESTASHAQRRLPIQPKDALEEGTVLLGDQWIHVSAYSKLPTEVTDTLSEADIYIDAFQGHLDVSTGYACVLSRTQCFVWNYSSRGIGTGAPTCFVFPVPEYASSSMSAVVDLSMACFLGRGAGREPALLLVAPDGQTCLWEGISSSLTRQDRAQRITAPLNSGETIVQMERVDEGTVVLATSQARLLRVSVGSRAGVLQAEIRPFSQSRGLLGRLFGSSSAMGSNDTITSLAISPSSPTSLGREVYAIGRKTVQHWHILENSGSERLLAEQDVQQLIASSVLQQNQERYSAAQSLAFDLLDASVASDGKLVLLYSQAKSEHEPMNFGLALLAPVKDAGAFEVERLLEVKYSAYADPRPYAKPSLSLPNGGPAVFVVFADGVVAKQLDVGCEGFEEVVKLKDDVKNRVIGSGCDTVTIGGENSVAALSLISATSGSLLVETSSTEIRKRCTEYSSSADRQRADTERLKGKLEQALYYSESPLNPLTFALPEKLQGTLMTAASQLSRELLTSTNPIAASVPPSVDLRAALKDRLGKLRFLVKFIAGCGHMEKLPQTTRRQLRADAELAAALVELWVYQNEFYSGGGGQQSALARAVEGVMLEQGLGGAGGEDLVRRFFRHHADLMGRVLDRLVKQSKATAAQPVGARSADGLELNRIALSAFRAALRYRKESGPLYGIEENNGASFEAWTAQPTSVALLESLYSLTVNLIPDRTRELGSGIDAALPSTSLGTGEVGAREREQRLQGELKAQLCSLAEITLACYEERLQYLEASTGADVERELAVFSATYRSARPAFIKPLVAIGRSDKAFSLAEQYRDFRTLVELSTDPTLASEARLDTYLDRYQEAFAFELYSFYIEHGRPRLVLEQKEQYASLVTSYLSNPQHDRLGWLHDLHLSRFSTASNKLEKLALGEEVLGQRKLMLSLSKLGFLSEMGVGEIQTVGVQKQVEFFDDHLDLIAVQESLVVLWENAIGGLPVDLPREGSAEAEQLAAEVVDAVAMRLVEYPAYRSHYSALVQKLLFGGKYLNSEDLVDLLTLKDAPENQLEDFATAIKVLVRAKDAPQQRLDAALRSIWRRAVIRDDWISLSETNNVSDQTMMADLQATALYAVLREVLGDEGNRGAYLDVQDLTHEPAGGEEGDGGMRKLLEARFADAGDDFMEMLMQDYGKEVATVGAFLEDSDLPRLAAELAGQAAREAEAEVEMEGEVAGEVSMMEG